MKKNIFILSVFSLAFAIDGVKHNRNQNQLDFYLTDNCGLPLNMLGPGSSTDPARDQPTQWTVRFSLVYENKDDAAGQSNPTYN